MKKFLVVIERKPSFTGTFIQGHRDFLKQLRESGELVVAGAFTDQSGGAYVVQAASLEEATSIASRDPMNEKNEAVYKVKEWNLH
ncbi:YciI family protein [Halalkalibacterium ligniniphilum]|uniref:YciI family protein n=1 Tax=Halalkalibacterium ligniniphilum TaxID=1134413 RepID=UPI00034B7703|nr:YciI family protein [Halalkalibacterium ligniniphilum]